MRNLPQASSRVTSVSRRKLYLAILTATQFMAVGQVFAGPEGGQVVGGAGSINQSGTETVINQQTDRMAIDWQSFDVKVDERVQFIQPSSSSVALNRVLSNKGSEILGRVDANGRVFLVNPNGVVFGKDSHINVGGILASGMSIDPTEFMNGNFTLNSLEGTEGKVINSGIINAATGGSVTLLGKEVKNEGLIVANLGAVNLAAGKEAVVTFDSSGLVGVKVTKAVLQNELGVDAAVLNTGEINAQGGRILLTASTSQDIFSQAVNHGELNATTSAVVNADGSFTLGAGADVVNTGTLNASSTNGDAGQIVALGNRVTNSGNISANTQNGHAGRIEFNSTDTTELMQNATVTAQATASGVGGDIKILGDKVGLLDSASVNASGANGGGQILIGGDKTGKNKFINNANFIYLGENTNAKTDALLNGNGGKLVTFAQDTARIYGNLFARGCSESGNGGFIETSGLKGFEILKTPDISAANGLGGSWLIDPYDISIGNYDTDNDSSTNAGGYLTNVRTYTSNALGAKINWSLIEAGLANGTGSTVTVQTGAGSGTGDITVDGDFDFDAGDGGGGAGGKNTGTLNLIAHHDIAINDHYIRSTIFTPMPDNKPRNNILNLSLDAVNDIKITGNSSIELNGGKFTAEGKNFVLGDLNNTSTASINTQGGDVSLTMTGAIALGNQNTIATLGGNFTAEGLNFTSTNAIIDTASGHTAFVNPDASVTSVGTHKGGGDISITSTDTTHTAAGDIILGELKFDSNANDSSAMVRLGSVTINSANDVYLEKEINFNDTGNFETVISNESSFIKIEAQHDIIINAKISENNNGDTRDSVAITFNANKTPSTNGEVKINKEVNTGGGDFIASGNQVKVNDGGKIITTWAGATGGDITITGKNFTLEDQTPPQNQTTPVTSISTKGGQVSLTMTGDISIGDKNAILTNGGNFTSNSKNFTSFDSAKFGVIDTTDSSHSGNLGITASGAIKLGKALANDVSLTSSSTGTSVDQSAVSGAFLDVGGTATFNVKAGIINLTNTANDFHGNVVITSAGNTDLTDKNSVTVGTSTVAGNFSLTAGGNISQSGILKVTNLATFDAGASNNIILNTQNNEFSQVKISHAKDASLKDNANDIEVTTTNPITNLTVNAVGNITDGSADSLNVTGLASFITAGNKNIVLDNTTNTFTKLNVQANNVTIFDSAGGITLGDSSTPPFDIKGFFNLETRGAVTQAKNIIVAGLTTITAQGQDITLADTANDFGKLAVTSARTADIQDVNNIELGSILLTGTAANSLKVTATEITQTAATKIENHSGGGVDLSARTSITLKDIDTSGANTTNGDGINGGDVSLRAPKIVTDALGLIKTTGGNAGSINSNSYDGGNGGKIIITANSTTVNNSITINGDLNANGGVGINGGLTPDQGDVTLTLASTSGTGNISVKNTSFFASNVQAISLNANDTFTGFDLASTWTTTASNIWDIEASTPTKTISLTNFENVAGGSAADKFNIEHTISQNVSGGANNDIFNIKFNAGTINGDNGNDTFNILASGIAVTKLYGGNSLGDAGADSVVGSDNLNSWNLTANGVGTLTSGNSVINFSGIETITGGTAVDTVVIGNTGINMTINGGAGPSINTLTTADATSDHNWTITSSDSGTLINSGTINFNQFGVLNGGSGVDKFITNTAFTGTLNGNEGVDTFTLSHNVSGDVNGGADNDTFNITFSVAGALNGDAGADTFNINATNLILSIFGGTSGTVPDIDILAGSGFANIWDLISTNKGTLTSGTVINFDEIETLNGGSGADTLNSATAGNNTWNLITNNSGSLNGLSFSAMENLVGNDNNDSVIFASTYTAIDPVLNAKGGTNTLDVSNIDNKTLKVKFTDGDFDSISGVKGVTIVKGKVNGINDTKGSSLELDSAVDATWSIADITGITADDGKNDGTLSIAGKSISFIDFVTLTGNTAKDDFTIASGNSFNGTFNGRGGLGLNTFTNSSTTGTWTLTDANKGDLVTSPSIKTAFDNIQTVTGNGSDTLIGQNLANTWNISGNKSGTLSLLTFYGMDNLTGGTNIDKFIIGSAGFIGGVIKGWADSVTSNQVDEIQIESTNTTKNHIWTISAINSGNLKDDAGTAGYGIASFEKIKKLVGGVSDDTFKFTGQSSIVDADGGLSVDKDIADFSLSDSVDVTLGTSSVNGVRGVEKFIGNNTNSTLKSGSSNAAIATKWTITGVNNGDVIIGANPAISFENFNNLVGGAGKDTFDFFANSGSALTGTISGGGSDDEIIAPDLATTWSISDSVSNEFKYGASTTLFNSVEILTGSAENVDTYKFSGSSTGKFTLTAKNAEVALGVEDILDVSGIETGISLNLGVSAGSGMVVSDLTATDVEKFIFNKDKNNTLTGYADGSNWIIDKENGGRVTSSASPSIFMVFDGFKNLVGADNKSDIFTFVSTVNTSGSVTGMINGGIASNSATANKIVGLNSDSNWNITGANSGAVSYISAFSNIQNLQGGSGKDKFTLASGVNFKGSIDGGAIGVNSLQAIDGANEFIITSANSGELNTNLIFTSINNLIGGAGVDTFRFNISTAFSGIIDAGTSTDVIDVVDFSKLVSAVTATVGENTIQGVTNAEKVIGNSNTETILKAINTSGDNTWTLTDVNAGIFKNANNNSIQFTNFAALLGAAGRGDSFTLQGSGSVASINGGAGLGTNSLAKADGTNAWVIGSDVNSGTLNTLLQFTNIQLLAGGSGLDTFKGHNKNNTWSILDVNAGSLKETSTSPSVNFTSMENLTGNAATDLFTFSTSNSNVTGLIDGGSSIDLSGGIVDTLDLQQLTAVNVELGNVQNPTSNLNLNVDNVEKITASSVNVNDNKLIGGSDRAYSWLIDGKNAGTVSVTPDNASILVPLEAKTNFINFGSVAGGTNADRFTVSGDIKDIDGGNGLGDFVDYSSKEADIEIVLNGSGDLGITGIKGIEGIVGNNNGLDLLNTYKSTIKISEGTNTWTLGSFDSVTDGINDGKLSINNSNVNVISFENFNILGGGSGADTFKLTQKGKFVGTINGGEGSADNVFNAAASEREQLISLNGSTSGATNLVGFNSVTGSSSAISELISLASTNTWILNSTNTNVNNVKLNNFSLLKGSDGVDTFNIKNIDGLKVKINGGGTSGTKDIVDITELENGKNVTIGIGAAATSDISVVSIEEIKAKTTNNNTLVADNSLPTNNWNIDGLNRGSLNQGVSFTGFANLTGGVGTDNFVFTNTGIIDGLIDGATSADSSSAVDTVNITAFSVPVTVELGNTNTNNLNLLNIEDVKANATQANKLIGDNSKSYTWVLNDTHSGTVAPTTKAPAIPLKESITAFSGFTQLQGGNNVDYFEIFDKWAGAVDGGNGKDFVDYSARKNSFTAVVGGTGNNGVTNVEGFVGNGANSTISIKDGTNTWTIGKTGLDTDLRDDGINDGTISFGAPLETVYFIDFNNITGGTGKDTFNINSGDLTGSIFAGDGDDTFNLTSGSVSQGIYGEDGDDILNITVVNTAGKINFAGGSGNANIINLTGGGDGYVAEHSSTEAPFLRYEVADKNYIVDYSGISIINDNVDADSLTIVGTLNSADVFALTTNSYSANNLSAINYTKKDNLIINGESTDKVEINGAVNVLSSLTIQGASVSTGDNGVINADSLFLDSTAAVGSIDKRIKTNISNLALNLTSGDTFLQEESALNLTLFNTGKLFDLSLAGNLTRSVALSSTGDFKINTGNSSGAILLDSNSDTFGANNLTGELSLNSKSNVKLTNSGTTTLKSLSAQSLYISSNGEINGVGDINVTGLAMFDSSGKITAKSETNNFNALQILNAAAVDLINSDQLSVQGIKATGKISLQSNGLDVTGKIESSDIEFNAGSKSAVIGGEMLSANNLSITAGSVDIKNSLTASAHTVNVIATAGQINQTAKITSGGNTRLTATGDIKQQADTESAGDIVVKAGGRVDLDIGKATKGKNVEYLVGGAASFLGSISANNGVHIEGKKEVIQSALLSSIDGDIKIEADTLTMKNDAITTATKGSVTINTANDISITALNAEVGSVNLVTSAGKVIDVNADKINILAKKFQVDSEAGIGTLTDAIETTVSELSLSNNSSNGVGMINIKNNAVVNIDRLRSNGDVTLTNIGNVVLDNSALDPYDKAATDARIAGGPMNANYNIGLLTINLSSGDLTGLGSPSLERPDITARAAVINAPLSAIGSKIRPLVIYVNKKLEVNALKLYQPYWGFNDKPEVVTGAKPISTSLSSDAGQLIQVETIDEVNPAIFTGVRNYVYDDIAILLPADQRYGDKDMEE